MPSINDVYGSEDLLKAGDLPAGVNIPVTIESVSPKSFDDGGKLEMRFVGAKKALICNKTNARTIADMLGEDYSHWGGRQIALVRTYTDYQGKQVECIRVVPNFTSQAPQQQVAAQPQQQFVAQPQQQTAIQGGIASPGF